MATHGIITKPRRKLLILGIGALLVLLIYVLSQKAWNMNIDPAIIASQEVTAYANREHLVPELFRLTDQSDGPNGRQIFDYEYKSQPIQLLRVDVSKDGTVEVSRMIEGEQ